MYYHGPSEREVEHAANVLELGPTERQQMYNFYRRERKQDREANIKLLKAIGRVVLKALVVSLILWACLQTWTERIPPQ